MPARKRPAPKDFPLRERIAWLGRFRALVAGSERALTTLIEREIGKPRWEAVTSDLLPLLASCRWHEKHAKRLLAPRKLRHGGVLGLGKTQHTRREPLGSVALIATWNYPVGLLGTQLVQGIVAGNRVHVKPSEACPETQSLLLDLAEEAGLPEGLLTITNATREAGAELLRNNRFDHVVFTGSTSVGTSIAEVLAPSLTPSTLELSGRDSAIVLHDADPKLAARTIWHMVEANAGQTCMAPKRALVHRDVYAQFLREMGFYAGAARPRRLISERAASEAFDQAWAAVDGGARSLSEQLEPPRGAWMRAHAIVDCHDDARLVEGRNFAPVIAVVPCSDERAMLAIHNACDQHLATSIFTRSPRRAAEELVPALAPVRTITFNDCVIPTAHPGASIGGVGASGWGSSQGEAGLLAMTRQVTVSTTSTLLRPPLDTPAPGLVDKMTGGVMRVYGAKGGKTPRTRPGTEQSVRDSLSRV